MDVEIRVVPKSVSEDTKLSVKCGDVSAEFTRSGNVFAATLPVNLFMGYDSFPMLFIETEGTVQTESLQEVDLTYLCYRYLPTIHTNIGHKTSHKNGMLEIDGHFTISGKPGSPDSAVEFINYAFVVAVILGRI